MIYFEIGTQVHHIDVEKNNIETIILFGSYIYGEADSKSDIDLIVIVDQCDVQELSVKKYRIARELGVPSRGIMMYTKSKFTRRVLTGKCFYQGLKTFGKILYSRSNYIDEMYYRMPLYANPVNEILNESHTVNWLMKEYRAGKLSEERIIHFLAHYIRSTCIYICYLHGLLEVRKYEPVRCCLAYEDVKMPFTMRQYKRLYETKRSYSNDTMDYKLNWEAHDYILDWYKKYSLLVTQYL